VEDLATDTVVSWSRTGNSLAHRVLTHGFAGWAADRSKRQAEWRTGGGSGVEEEQGRSDACREEAEHRWRQG
jgi:hypothetical protein